MPSREQPKKSVEELREGILALVKRSAAKFEEMKGIQARIDRLAEELAKMTDADPSAHGAGRSEPETKTEQSA